MTEKLLPLLPYVTSLDELAEQMRRIEAHRKHKMRRKPGDDPMQLTSEAYENLVNLAKNNPHCAHLMDQIDHETKRFKGDPSP